MELFWWIMLAGGSTIAALLIVTWALLRANALASRRDELIAGRQAAHPLPQVNERPLNYECWYTNDGLEFARGKDGKITYAPSIAADSVTASLGE